MNQTLQKIIKNSGQKPCQICKEPELLIEHHIHGREIPDFDKFWNRCYICSNCHNKIHHGLIIVEGWFTTTEGLELIWHWKDEESLTGIDAKPHLI